MGYYTYFKLYVPTFEDGILSEQCAQLIEDEVDKMDVFEDGDIVDGFGGEAKWYDWEADMTLLSTRFPDVLFYLHGDGDNSDDHWDAYFMNGKCQYCPAIIHYDGFDKNKLRPGKVNDDTRDGFYTYQDRPDE